MQPTNHLPLIGISTGRSSNANTPPAFSLNEAYVEAVSRAGGLPVIIPSGLPSHTYENILHHLSGLLLTGGGDIDPQQYQTDSDNRAKLIDPDRDRSEMDLLSKAIEIHLPFMGICRGIQIVNVALGGTLFVDVKMDRPNSLKHDYYPASEYPRDHYAHSMEILPDNRLFDIFGKDKLMTNSLHHQGLNQLGTGLTPVAIAPDGLVEGVQYSENPFGIALQWHPECLPEDPNMQNLFSAFITESKRYGESK